MSPCGILSRSTAVSPVCAAGAKQAISFEIFDPRSLLMGDGGVSSGNAASAACFNPALHNMARQWLRILIAWLIGCQGCALPAAGENPAVRQAGLLVGFKQNVSRDAAADILSRQGASEFAPLQRGRAVGPTPMDRWWIVRFPAGSDLQKAAAALRAEAAVEIVEVEGPYRVPQ